MSHLKVSNQTLGSTTGELWFASWQEQEIYVFPKRVNPCETHSASCKMNTGNLSLRVKHSGCEEDHFPSSNVEVKNDRSSASIPHIPLRRVKGQPYITFFRPAFYLLRIQYLVIAIF